MKDLFNWFAPPTTECEVPTLQEPAETQEEYIEQLLEALKQAIALRERDYKYFSFNLHDSVEDQYLKCWKKLAYV